MTIQDWMRVFYPILAVSLFVYCCLLVAYYLSVRPIRLLIASGTFFALELLGMTMLSLANGASPIFDINELRPWITLARFLMIPCVWWMIAEVIIVLQRAIHRPSRAHSKFSETPGSNQPVPVDR